MNTSHFHTRKNNFLPDERFVTKIILRNKTICKDIDSLKNPKIKNEFVNYSDELIPKLWKYARFSGFKPYEKSLTYNIPQNTGYLPAADSGKWEIEFKKIENFYLKAWYFDKQRYLRLEFHKQKVIQL